MSHDDVARSVIAELEAEADYVDDGEFVIDQHRAREKLAAFQLADPQHFVCLLVEAAHLFEGCTGVAYTIGARQTDVVLRGATLGHAELEGLLESLMVSAPVGPGGDRVRACQALAMAINTALGFDHRGIELVASHQDGRAARLAFDASGERTLELAADCHVFESVRLSVRERLLEPGRGKSNERRRSALRTRCRYSTLPIAVDGNLLRAGLDLAESQPILVEGDDLGVVGWDPWRVGRPGMLRFVANGVLLESFRVRRWPRGVVGIVDASALGRDLSRGKVARGQGFDARVLAAHDVAMAFTKPPPIALRSLGAVDDRWSAPTWTLAVATVVRCRLIKRLVGWMSSYALELSVEAPDGAPFHHTVDLSLDPDEVAPPRPDQRVFVRVDPERRSVALV